MNEKLIKTARTADTVAGIVKNVLKVCAIVFLVFAVLVMIFGEKMFEAGSLSLELDYITLQLSGEYQTVDLMMQVFTAATLVAGAISFAVISLCCAQLQQILAPMKEGRPFDEQIPEKLRKTAWIVLIGGALSELIGVVGQICATVAYPLEEVFASDAIDSWNVSVKLDSTFALVFLVLMLLSYVFAYGVQLQREADETL